MNVQKIEGLRIIWMVLILKIHRIRILRAQTGRNGIFPLHTGKNTRIRILLYTLVSGCRFIVCLLLKP